MNVVIIEDEPYAVDRLQLQLKEICPEARVVKTLDSISGAISFFKSNPANLDLLFLDVELADGVSFEIFKEVNLNIPIIFTTAYDAYAIQAFDLNSKHYLLKPVQTKDLKKAIEKYEQIEKSTNIDLIAIRELITNRSSNYRSHFLGKYGNKLVHKATSDIAYFFSEDKMVYMVDSSKKKYLIDYTLDALDSQMLDSHKFFRVSRRFIVNIESVEVLQKYFNQRLQLMLDIGQEHEIVVSREKVSDFKMWLNM